MKVVSSGDVKIKVVSKPKKKKGITNEDESEMNNMPGSPIPLCGCGS